MEVMRGNPSNRCNSRLFYACHLHENGEGSAMKNRGASIVSEGQAKRLMRNFAAAFYKHNGEAFQLYNLLTILHSCNRWPEILQL